MFFFKHNATSLMISRHLELPRLTESGAPARSRSPTERAERDITCDWPALSRHLLLSSPTGTKTLRIESTLWRRNVRINSSLSCSLPKESPSNGDHVAKQIKEQFISWFCTKGLEIGSEIFMLSWFQGSRWVNWLCNFLGLPNSFSSVNSALHKYFLWFAESNMNINNEKPHITDLISYTYRCPNVIYSS